LIEKLKYYFQIAFIFFKHSLPALPLRKDEIKCKFSEIDPIHFQYFTYARRSHWQLFKEKDKELFGRSKNMDYCDLKVYQDLFVYTFIKNHIPLGSRILEVGGGDSRILKKLAAIYECWNIDKLEGIGCGPRELKNIPYKLILDYMGNFNLDLPNNSFDFVFSISALEHVNQEMKLFDNIIDDINRVLKPNAFSLHLFDVIFMQNDFWTNPFVHRIFQRVNTFNTFEDPQKMMDDPDLYYMNKASYNRYWKFVIKKKYEDIGRPSSLNILWRKGWGQNPIFKFSEENDRSLNP